MKVIRPRRVNWPTLFWQRANSSYADNDLVCQDCLGRCYQVSRESAWPGITAKEVACPTCRSSGLLVPARDLPDDPDAIWAADEEGAGWLEWAGHTGDGLFWPLPWAWTISRRRFRILRGVYLGGEVLAFMSSGSLVVGLYELDLAGLEKVFRMACGEAIEVPSFVMPRRLR